MGKSTNETIDESKYRMGVVNREIKSTLPRLGLILLVLVGLLVGTTIGRNNVISKGIGNPYECMDCKKLGFACKEHKNYDSEELLRYKIDKVVSAYGENGDIKLEDVYGKDNTYNTKCDFCESEEKECYSCMYNREAIRENIKQIYNEGIFKTKLCADCWNKGYADCNIDKDYLSKEVYNKIKGDE